jgi:hypothetical protein
MACIIEVRESFFDQFLFLYLFSLFSGITMATTANSRQHQDQQGLETHLRHARAPGACFFIFIVPLWIRLPLHNHTTTQWRLKGPEMRLGPWWSFFFFKKIIVLTNVYSQSTTNTTVVPNDDERGRDADASRPLGVIHFCIFYLFYLYTTTTAMTANICQHHTQGMEWVGLSSVSELIN